MQRWHFHFKKIDGIKVRLLMRRTYLPKQSILYYATAWVHELVDCFHSKLYSLRNIECTKKIFHILIKDFDVSNFQTLNEADCLSSMNLIVLDHINPHSYDSFTRYKTEESGSRLVIVQFQTKLSNILVKVRLRLWLHDSSFHRKLKMKSRTSREILLSD